MFREDGEGNVKVSYDGGVTWQPPSFSPWVKKYELMERVSEKCGSLHVEHLTDDAVEMSAVFPIVFSDKQPEGTARFVQSDWGYINALKEENKVPDIFQEGVKVPETRSDFANRNLFERPVTREEIAGLIRHSLGSHFIDGSELDFRKWVYVEEYLPPGRRGIFEIEAPSVHWQTQCGWVRWQECRPHRVGYRELFQSLGLINESYSHPSDDGRILNVWWRSPLETSRRSL
jgi:hypothetical protein